jgi:dipeptidyl aminopeptidase/acylaminoacyl peptidase
MRVSGILVCALVAMAAVPASAETPPPPQPRPASDFAALPFMVGPDLSPDGRRMAAQISVSGQQMLGIDDLFDKAKPVLISLGDNDLLSWSWVNDQWLAVRVGAIVNVEGSDFYVTRVMGVPADGSRVVPISFRKGGWGADIIWTARDGSPRIAMAMQKSIYNDGKFWPDVDEVDVSTGKSRTIVPGRTNVMQWVADPNGVIRMGVGYNDESRSSRLLYRPDASASFRIVDRADDKKDERLAFPILLAGGADKALSVSRQNGFDALYEFDLQSLAVGKVIHEVPGYDIDGVILTPDGTGVSGIRYTSDTGHMHWLDPALADIQAQLDKAVGQGRFAKITALSRDQKKLLVWVGDASQPGSYYYYDAAAGGVMTRYAYVNNAFKTGGLGPVSTYRYKTQDGLSVEAILTLPKDRAAKNLPLILMPHGGPAARDTASYDWWAQFLADRGYAVVQPNYRGSTGYGEKFQDAGDGEWGLKMQDDLNDAVADLAAKGTVDPKRVCIAGGSYGGYAAMRGAQRDGAKFRCAISYAGVSDLMGMLTYDSGFLYGNSARAYWKKIAPDLKDVSPINHPADFSTPILIMHGKKDKRVPVAQSRRMFDRLKAAGKPVEYIEQPLGDHYFSRQADRQQFLEAIEAFLKKHNPA